MKNTYKYFAFLTVNCDHIPVSLFNRVSSKHFYLVTMSLIQRMKVFKTRIYCLQQVNPVITEHLSNNLVTIPTRQPLDSSKVDRHKTETLLTMTGQFNGYDTNFM